MSEKGGLAVKTPVNKRKDPGSKKPKADLSQSQFINSPVEQILYLQRTIGNRAVTHLFQSGAIQARFKIGKPNDIYEKEADRVSERVMRMRDRSLVNGHWLSVQPKSACPECPEKEGIQTELQRQPEEEEKPVQSKTAPGNTNEVTPNIESNINSMKGGGQPLSESTRSFFEPRFGADFSQVRVHNDSRAANTAQAVNAKAFTTGKDVVFNSGQYSPGTSSGKRLLAHELTHIVQQGNSSGIRKNNYAFRNAPVLQSSGIALQRKLDPRRVKYADKELWARHPELKGRKLTLSKADAPLRKEWWKYYKWKKKGPDKKNSQKYLISEKSQEISFMVFDGKKVFWKDSSGKTVLSVSAISGLKKNNKKITKLIKEGRTDIKRGQDYTEPKYQDLSDVGPIPEGEYTLKLVKGVPLDKKGGGWGFGGWLLHSGFIRKMGARLGLARSGFFLHHDGGNDGTSGCIGIRTKEGTQVIWNTLRKYQKAGHKSIVVKVEY